MGKQKKFIEALKEATAGYSTEVLKLAASQVTLSTAQATAIFEAKGLTGAELEQAVATATLATTQKSSTVAINLNTMSKIGNKVATKAQISEETKSLLVKGKLITEEQIQAGTTVQLTKAKIADAVATGALTKAEGKQLVSTLGLTSATGGFGAAIKGLGVSIKSAASALLSNPFILLGTIIFGLGGSFVYATQATERAKKAAQKSKDEYEKVKSELEEINHELQTTKSQIDELNAKENLSLIESEELENLKETNKELERKLRLQESIAQEKSKEANEDAVKYFGSKSSYGTTTGNIEISGDQLDILDFQLNKVKELEEYFKTVSEENKDFLFIQNEKLLSFLKSETAKTVEEFMQTDDSLIEGYDNGYLDRLEQLYQRYDEIFNGVAESHTTQIQAILDKVNFSDYEQQLLDLATNGRISVETIISKFPDLISYLNQAGISAQELYQYIMNLSNPDAVKFDELKKQLNEALGLNSAGDTRAIQIGKIISDNNLYSDDALTVFASIKAKYVNGETDSWTAEDWISNIQQELNKGNLIEVTPTFNAEEFSKSISSVTSAYSTLTSAMEEYNTNGAYSLDTLDKLLSLSPEYLSLLIDENGQMKLNEEGLRSIVNAQLEKAKSEIYATGIAKLKALTDESAAQASAESASKIADSAKDIDKQTRAYNENSLAIATNEALNNGAKRSDVSSIVKETKAQVKAIQSAVNGLSFNIGGVTGGFKDTKSATKEAETDWKDFLDKEIKALEKQLDAGYIDFSSYITKRKALIEDYYNTGKIKAADYYSELEAMYKSQQNFYDDVLSAVTRRLDVEIDKWQTLIDNVERENDALEKQKDNYDAVISAIQKVIQSKKDEVQNAIDALEEENDKIQEQVDDYDSVLRAVDKVYEAEIKSLQDQQAAIDDKIKALREANDEEKRGIELEKAKAELARAQTQRTKYTFNGEQFVYTTDNEAIRDAKEKISDLELEQTISNMEKEKEALQRTIDKLDEYRQKWTEIADAYQNAMDKNIAQNILGQDYDQTVLLNRIEDIEAFKERYVNAQTQMDDNTSMIESYQEKLLYYDSLSEKWSSIATLHEEAVNRELAAQILGADWEHQILEGRVVTFDGFKNQYLAIQDQIEDNTGLIASYEEKIVYYQNLKDQWSSITDAYKNSMEDQKAAMLLGADWEAKITNGRLDVLNNFRNEYITTQKAIADAAWNSANEQIKAAKEAEKGAKGNTGSAGTIGEPKKTTDKYKVVDTNGQTISSGLNYKDADNMISASGKQDQWEIKKFSKGGLITDTPKNPLNGYASILGEDQIIGVQNGERVLTKEQNINWEEMTKHLPDFLSMAKFMPNFNIPSYDMVPITKEEPLSFSIGEIHLHEVRNPDAFAETLIRELPNKMLQALNRRRM